MSSPCCGIDVLTKIFGVYAQDGVRVSWDVDFGDYADVTCGGVCDKIADFVLSVVFLSLGKLWVAEYLYAEPLIVGKVQLQDVEFETSHFIDISLDGMYGYKVPCGIEHKCTVAVTWCVLNFYGRDAYTLLSGCDICKHPLVKCVDGVENCVVGCTAECDTLVRDGHGVLFPIFCQAWVYAQCYDGFAVVGDSGVAALRYKCGKICRFVGKVVWC